MKGDRVEAVVDTGQGTQTFVIEATRNGRRLEVTTSRGVVEVSEVTRGGSPVRTGRFMARRITCMRGLKSLTSKYFLRRTRRPIGGRQPQLPAPAW